MTPYIEENFLGSYRIKLDPSFVLDRHIIEKGVCELPIVQLINKFVRPGAVCVDVGANAGYHTLAMAGAVGASGHVYAFEPNEITFSKLKENLELNSSLRARVTCEKLGLSSESGELKVFQAGEEAGNAYVSAEYNERFWNGGTPDDYSICKVVRLDSYINSDKKVSFIKADVEGMELEVLMGADALLKRDKPVILFETLLENFNHEKIKKLEEYLRSLDYLILGIDPDTGMLTQVGYPNFGSDSLAITRSQLEEFNIPLVEGAK